MDLHPYAGLAACKPGREARFRRENLLISMRYQPREWGWEIKIWAGRHRTSSALQLESIISALELDFWCIESYLSADFESYTYLIHGGRHIPPSLMSEYESILYRRQAGFGRKGRWCVRRHRSPPARH